MAGAADLRWPGPARADPAQSAASLAQTLAMHATLRAFTDVGAGRETLLAMPQREHWHPRMMWYGPAGIGTARGLAGFVDRHQLPFRAAFPRPTTERGGKCDCQGPRPNGGRTLYPDRRRSLFRHRGLAEPGGPACRSWLSGVAGHRPDRRDAGDGLLPAPRGANPGELGAARHTRSPLPDGGRRPGPHARGPGRGVVERS